MPRSLIDKTTDIPAHLCADLQLDPTIQPDAPMVEYWDSPTAVFLTGATGFLGAYLVQELMTRTHATIHYLSRQATPQDATDHLVQQLQGYQVWRDEFLPRLVPVLGDLARPRLGLAESDFVELADRVQVLYHNGSWVNNLYDYARLKPTNVNGAHELIRLAALRRTKPLHFISSMAVFFSAAHPPATPIHEDDIPLYSHTLRRGYTLSKWVADHLMLAAQARGLPVTIYRPVRVGGHSRTGVSKAGQDGSFDLLNTLIKGSIELGLFPDLNVEIPLVPVDYVSGAVVHLASQRESWGKAFHLVNQRPMRWANLYDLLRSSGYTLERMPYAAWLRMIKHKAATLPSRSSFAVLYLMLTTPNNLHVQRPPFLTDHIQLGLADSGIVCPPLDHALMGLYLDYFQQVGYLPVPSGHIPKASLMSNGGV